MVSRAEAGVDITARNRMQRAVDQANGQLKGLNRTAQVATRAFGALAAAFGTRQLIRFGTEAVRQLDNIAKSAQTAGVAGETLQELRFAMGELAGVAEREVDLSLQRFNRRLGLAIEGGGAAKDTFRELGIAMTDQAGRARDTEAVLDESFRALANIEDASIRAAKASEIFGEEAGPKLAGALSKGIGALEQTRKETVGLIGEGQLKDAELLNDAFGRMASTIGNTLRASIVGATADMADFFGLIEREIGVEQLQAQLALVQRQIRRGMVETSTGVDLIEEEARLRTAIMGAQERAAQIEVQNRAARELEKRLGTIRQGLSQLSTEGFEMLGQGPDIELDSVEEAHAVRQERLRAQRAEKLQSELEDLRLSMRTREEVELEAHDRRLETLRNAFEMELLTKEEFVQREIDLARRTQEQLNKITREGLDERQKFEQASAQAKVAIVLGNLAEMTAGVAQHNKAMFQLNKVAAIANAIISTHAGVTKALEAYPPPLSFVMAAAQAAAGFAQVAAIRSASFAGGGAGTTPSAAGATPTVNSQPTQLPQIAQRDDEARAGTVVQITVQGSIMGLDEKEAAAALGNRLRDLIDNDDFEIMGRDSRQVADIRRR